MDKCEPVEDTAVGKGNVEAQDTRVEHTAEVGCRAPAVDSACSASPVERLCPGDPSKSASDTNSPSCSAPPLSASVAPGGSDVPAQHAGFLGPSESLAADEDCLICVNRYSPSRLPKVLSCQHVFCAVCLKLLLHNDGHTWHISCPICRQDTAVFGGLIGTLPTTEEASRRFPVSPGLGERAAFFPDHPTAPLPAHGIFYIRQDDESSGGDGGDGGGGSNRAAARRLLFLLLLLVSLVALALPFLYTGLMKWALCVVVGWGLAMAVLLCWNPRWQCGCTGIWRSAGPKAAGRVPPPA